MTSHGTPPAADTAWILGSWHLLRCDAPLEFQPGTRMHFGADQQLEYTIPTPDGTYRVTLDWRLTDGVLRTAHHDGSHPVEVRASLGAGDVLTYDFDGPRAWFVRAR